MADVECHGLRYGPPLYRFLCDEALPGSGVAAEDFFSSLARLIEEFGPRNRQLLDRRRALQASIDDWHRERAGQPHDAVAYRTMLEQIGYLAPVGEAFTVETENVDAELSATAGPQLVVPVTNARYALNAANARWGSLFDALYGTDALGTPPPSGPYDPERGACVIEWARRHLDAVAPLASASHGEVARYAVVDGALRATVEGGTHVSLVEPRQLVAYTGEPAAPTSILLERNGLHIELVIDRNHPVGADDPAGLADVVVEAAVTVIMDLEDSVATVDAEDKASAYRNWLGLMRGDLRAEVTKNDATSTRALHPDRAYTRPDGGTLTLPATATMLVRNVGHLMTTPAVRDAEGNEVPEGLLDAMITVLCALHDVRAPSGARNSRHGSIYVVKPKMHGPEEVAFADEVFSFVERALDLPEHTVKLGIMDEERRTTVNLIECIRAARRRVCFINTGFLDRTGDEIHTSMHAGPMVRKADMKQQRWMRAYEDWNVDVGLACGLRGRGQIGKGMWAVPDRMADMLRDKIAHPAAGATCAWVPSPTAATLHATHYHHVDVHARQRELEGQQRATLEDLLALPLASPLMWTPAERRAELDNNVQGILGYVVRWIDQGVGCSKVPDIDDVGLMEDRATCRISSQHVANWLLHGVVTAQDVDESLRRMALVVDAQNAGDPNYTPMAPSFDGDAFNAARALVFSGVEQPSGYTEQILHRHRLHKKSAPSGTP
jgi:malate synthase